ncbi:hypothetical protein [Nocardioides caldifontis]|uniref:hypothetical protein n=1 Tax=Nocardioides caldifontis TaxID=2588938 RepID=UPI0011E039B2|nr:hypothetical protein [Nocardioides caldifontis]
MKVSLHQSGDWRLQVVEPDRPKTVWFDRLDGGLEGRVLDRWQRPQPNAVGWTHALSIVLPEHHLVTIPNDGDRWDDVRWLPTPHTGEHVAFEVSLVTPGLGIMSCQELVLNGGRFAVMDALELASGDVALVLALTLKTDEVEAVAIARCEAVAAHNLPSAAEFDRSPQLGPRYLVHGVSSDGRRRYYDLAFTQRD